MFYLCMILELEDAIFQEGARNKCIIQLTIGIQKKLNPHINFLTQKEQFIKNRDNRDKALKSPRLLLQSLQVNIDAGKLPVKEQNKQRYLKIPINQK